MGFQCQKEISGVIFIQFEMYTHNSEVQLT